MNTERFKNYDNEVKELVLDFEEMQRHDGHRYYDVDQLTIIIDYYLETFDNVQLEKAVLFAESLFPTNNEILLRRSHLLCTKEHFAESLSILEELERQEPNNTDVQYALGAVLSALEKPRKAIQHYLKASSDGYELCTIYANVGDEYVRLGLYSEAVSYYRRAIDANPDEERAVLNLCDSLQNLHKEKQGINFFSQFVESHPYNKAGWFCLGLLYRCEKLYEKAIDAFEFVTTIDNKHYETYMQKAACYYEMQQIPQAITALREGLDYVEDKASINATIGFYYMETGNYVTAVIYLKEALNIDPHNGDNWMAMASCYAGMDEYYAAMDCIDRAFKETPNEPALLIDAARIYAHFNEEEKAIKYFEEGLQLTSYNDRCWTDFADFLIDHNKYDEAIEILNRGITLCDNPFLFNGRLAICYYLTGRRNFLFNALRACVQDDRQASFDLLTLCPGMASDLEVMDILTSE